MPWWVTHSIDSGASRRSSESRRTVWMPGSTSVPLPVTMRKPMLSPAPSGEVLAQAGDHQGLVGLGDPPHELEDREQDGQADDDATGQDQDPLLRLSTQPYMGLTTTVRGGKYSITTTRVPVEMVSVVSAA